MLNLILPIIETSLNKALSLDPKASTCLAKLDQKKFEIHITDWNLTFFMSIHNTQIHCLTKKPSPITASISASLPAFIRIVLKGAKTAAFFENQIEITGDTIALEKLSHIFKQLDIDWEEQLAQWSGDGLAHKTFFHTKKILRECKNISQKLCDNTSDYLKYESKQLVGHAQVKSRQVQINQLRNDVDRLAARIDRLETTDQSGAS